MTAMRAACRNKGRCCGIRHGHWVKGLLFAGKFGTAASTGVVMPPKPQMIAKQDWRYVSGGGRVMRNAHEPSTEITSLAFASNGHSLASRGADETLKVCLSVCLSV